MLTILCLQDKLPEDGIVLGIVLFLDLLNSIVRDTIFIGTAEHSDETEVCEKYSNASNSKIVIYEVLEAYYNETKANGIASISVFTTLLFLLILTLITVTLAYIVTLCRNSSCNRNTHYSPILTLVSCCKCCHEDSSCGDHSHMSYIACIIQCLLTTLYFISDNLGQIAERNGTDIGCNAGCYSTVQMVAKVFSVASILLLYAMPYLLHHFVKAKDNWKYELEEEKRLYSLSGNVEKVDAA